MNRHLFYQYLDNPHLLDEESLKHLNELVAEYPYFQVGRMLLVKNLAVLGHIRYNSELKNAAAHIPDRRQLYYLVNSPLAVTSSPNAMALLAEPIVEPENEITSPISDVEENEHNFTASSAPLFDTETTTSEEHLAEELAPSMNNYFDVSDIIDLDQGFTIDFSKAFNTKPEPEIDVLPTADLLDYELTTSPAYDLNEELAAPFDPNQTQPFSMWLKALRHPPKAAEKDNGQPAPIDKQMLIIENFLQKGRDRIVPGKNEPTEQPQEDISVPSVQESEALMTETLANIHIKQKQYQKAIVIFEKLSLKYPEKSIYFAARIKETEHLISNL